MAKKKIKKKPSKKPATLNQSPTATTLAPSAQLLKLDLAAGQTPREGFEGVDIWPGSQHKVDLTKYPWPFADNSVDELHCSHYIEHIEMLMVDETGKPVWPGDPGRETAKEALFKFFDECYRILRHEGWMTVICPAAQNTRAFQDPTHRRFITQHTFLYLWKRWRQETKLDHYNVDCDFGAEVGWTVEGDVNLKSPEAQQMYFKHYWGSIYDWHVKLQAFKLPR